MDRRQQYRYEDSREFYDDYFDQQKGNGYGAYEGRSVVPSRGMSGAGFGSVLAKLARKALPYAKVVGKRLLNETAGMAGDLLEGEKFATSAKRRLISAGRGVVSDLTSRKRPAKKNGKVGRTLRKKQPRMRSPDVFG